MPPARRARRGSALGLLARFRVRARVRAGVRGRGRVRVRAKFDLNPTLGLEG